MITPNPDDIHLDQVINCDGITVAEWSPDPIPGRTPPTQVHMLIAAGVGINVIVRLKSSRAVDELIQALQTHRRGVWGEPSQLQGPA